MNTDTIRIERLTGTFARLCENTRLEHALLARFLGFRGRIASIYEALTDLWRGVFDRRQRWIVRQTTRCGEQYPFA